MTEILKQVSSRVERRLHAGEYKIGVWGTGFIGFSTMAYFANEGVACVGYDIDAEVVKKINAGRIPIDNLQYWLGFETEQLVEDGLMRGTTDHEELIATDTPVHFVSIPTEKDGSPWVEPLRDVVEKLAGFTDVEQDVPTLVIIESTLTPGMTDDIVVPTIEDTDLRLGSDIVIGVAPRRDWFISPDKTLPTLPRVYGGQDDAVGDYMEQILGIVCENLIRAKDYQHAELVKSIENAYRHVGISLANQLSRAYPDIDMREVLKLVGTKWNIPTYFPSIGTGGYCIPLSSQYVLSGTDNPDQLSILNETIQVDREQPRIVADVFAEGGFDTVAILGLAYKEDIKVDTLSPTYEILDRLQERGIECLVHDPYYDDQYIETETGAQAISFPEGLTDATAVLLATNHRQYTYTPDREILDSLDNCELILDNHRTWEPIPFDDTVEYVYTGGENWLSPLFRERPTLDD